MAARLAYFVAIALALRTAVAQNASNATTSTATTTAAPAATTTLAATTANTTGNASAVTTTMMAGGATTTTEAAQGFTISLTLTVTGISLEALNNNLTVKAAFELSCISTIVTEAGNGVTASMVTVVLEAGSVNVVATITVPAESSISSSAVQSQVLAASTSGGLTTALVSGLSSVSGLSDITTGTLAATVSVAPTLTVDSNTNGSLPSSGAQGQGPSAAMAAAALAAIFMAGTV